MNHLVLGKNAVIRPEITANNLSEEDKIRDVIIEIREGSTAAPIASETVKAGTLTSSTKVNILFTPVTKGNATLNIQARFLDADLNDKTSQSNTVEKVTNNIPTNKFRLMYATIFACEKLPESDYCYGYNLKFPENVNKQQQEFDEAIQYSNRYLSGILPVSDSGGFTISGTQFQLEGNNPKSNVLLPQQYSAYQDLFNLESIRKRFDLTSNKIVGLVPGDYFAKLGFPSGVLGLTSPWLSPNTALSVPQSPSTPAHEIAHLFGLDHKVSSSNGFWPAEMREMVGNISIMTAPGPQGGLVGPNGMYQRWPDLAEYKVFFDTLRANDVDPPNFLIRGLLFKDGTIANLQTMPFTEGTTTPSTGNDLTIQVLDGNNSIIASVGRKIEFKILFDTLGSVSEMETDAIPMSISIPYPENAERIKIYQGNTLISSFSPLASSLRDAIASTPDNAYQIHPDFHRRTLLERVEKIEFRLEKNKHDVLERLKNLRKDVTKLLKDNFEISNQNVLTKAQIIALIDDVTNRVGKIDYYQK